MFGRGLDWLEWSTKSTLMVQVEISGKTPIWRMRKHRGLILAQTSTLITRGVMPRLERIGIERLQQEVLNDSCVP